MVESAFENPQPHIQLPAHEENFTGLIGAECQAETRLRQPVKKVTRALNLQPGFGESWSLVVFVHHQGVLLSDVRANRAHVNRRLNRHK